MVEQNNVGINELTESEMEEAELRAQGAHRAMEVRRILNCSGIIKEILIHVQLLDDAGFSNEEIRQMEAEVEDAWDSFYCAIEKTVHQRIYKRIL